MCGRPGGRTRYADKLAFEQRYGVDRTHLQPINCGEVVFDMWLRPPNQPRQDVVGVGHTSLRLGSARAVRRSGSGSGSVTKSLLPSERRNSQSRQASLAPASRLLTRSLAVHHSSHCPTFAPTSPFGMPLQMLTDICLLPTGSTHATTAQGP